MFLNFAVKFYLNRTAVTTSVFVDRRRFLVAVLRLCVASVGCRDAAARGQSHSKTLTLSAIAEYAAKIRCFLRLIHYCVRTETYSC